MSFIDGAVGKAALNMLRGHIKKNNITMGCFWLDEKDNVDVKFYNVPAEITSTQELTELRRVYALWLNGELIEKEVTNAG